jgi:DNA-binding NtrC family response regulator
MVWILLDTTPQGGTRVPIPKVLVFSRRPPEEGGISTILTEEGYQVEWTDSGPAAICEALSGALAACILFVGRNAEREVDYIPCLNRVDPKLPIIVISEHDSVELQRKIRRHRVYYYLLLPLDRDEIRAVLRSVARPPAKRRKRS